MALKNCINCGKEYSDTVEQCPYCNYKAVVYICPECRKYYGRGDKFCMYCGMQLPNANRTDATQEQIQEELRSIVNRLKGDISKDEQAIILHNLTLFEFTGENTELIAECKKILQDKKDRLLKSEEYNKICEALVSVSTSNECMAYIEKLQGFPDLFNVDESVLKFSEKYKELLYNETTATLNKIKTLKEWKNAEAIFMELGDFKDSVQQKDLCYKKYRVTKYRVTIITILAYITYILIFVIGFLFISCQ